MRPSWTLCKSLCGSRWVEGGCGRPLEMMGGRKSSNDFGRRREPEERIPGVNYADAAVLTPGYRNCFSNIVRRPWAVISSVHAAA